MPLIEKGKLEKVREKRKSRTERLATKYQLRRKPKTHKQYEHIEVYVDGQKVELSDSSKYLIDMMIKG